MAKITVEYLKDLMLDELRNKIQIDEVCRLLNEKASEEKWISVKDQLPDLGQFGDSDCVLCIESDGNIEKVWYNGHLKIWYGRQDNCGDDMVFNPTNWMPLPNKLV